MEEPHQNFHDFALFSPHLPFSSGFPEYLEFSGSAPQNDVVSEKIGNKNLTNKTMQRIYIVTSTTGKRTPSLTILLTLLSNWETIAGFHCHTIIKTIQQIKSRIKEIKEDEYSNSLAKVRICATFRAGDTGIQRNVLLKFIRFCMETSCLCPSEGTNMAA